MKTLKMAQKDIADRTKVLATLQKLEEAIGENRGKMTVMAHEFGKVGMYRDVINKQEAMIIRLEGILKTMASQTKTVRIESETYYKEREENDRLRTNIETYQVPDNHGEFKQLKTEVRRLEEEITKLQGELVSNRPVSSHKSRQVNDIASKEVTLEKYNARIFALERQIGANTTSYAQQITVLKAKIAEKDAVLISIQKQL